jgi:hypothetical protein
MLLFHEIAERFQFWLCTDQWNLAKGLPEDIFRNIFVYSYTGASGSVVAKELCYKPEGRGFETQWGQLISSIYLILPAALGPAVYSASNRNECQEQKNNIFGE